MATTAVTVEQYLHTSYQPDRDYVDGEVLERNLGEREHSSVQGEVFGWFYMHRSEWKLLVFPEQRCQITQDRFRVPDIVVLTADAPFESVVQQPPLIVVEVLSPEDRRNAIRDRLEDYSHIGVQNIWVLDPYRRLGWTYRDSQYKEVDEAFTVPGTDIFLRLREAFAGLPPA